MAGIKLGMVVQRPKQQVEMTFKDDAGKVLGEVTLGRDSIEAFIGQLVAARELLKAETAEPHGVKANGAVRLPPPMAYYSMTGGTDTKSGLPVLGFKVGPDLWPSFRIEPEGVPGLAKLMGDAAARRGA